MKAAIIYGSRDVRVEDVEMPELKPGEVRVKIGAALTCGTDLKVFKRGYHAKMIQPPAVFGHEFAGSVSGVGDGLQGWQSGERVVVANSAPCGECFFCQHEQESLCEDLLFLNGAYAEFINVPARIVEKNMLRIGDETKYVDAALTEPLACVVQGIAESRLWPGDRVLVIGAGPIGLMFTALAHHLGCHVTVAGRGEQRLAAAKKLGAYHTIDMTGRDDVVAGVRERFPNENSFDVVIEATGKPEVWEAAVSLVRKGGLVNFFGGCPSGTSITLDTGRLHYSSITLRASFHHTPDSVRKALDFIRKGVICADDFVNGESPLSELPALLNSMAESNHAVKTLIDVSR
jgi:L-iditol 2-dehydrogenase